MNKKVILFLAFVVSSFSMRAQLNVTPAAGSGTPAGTFSPQGQKVVQLARAIRPASYTSAFKKEMPGFVAKAGNSGDAASLVKNISILAGAIKPDKFKTGVTAAGLLKGAAAITTVAQANTLLLNVESGLKPKALSDVWQLERSQWVDDLKGVHSAPRPGHL